MEHHRMEEWEGDTQRRTGKHVNKSRRSDSDGWRFCRPSPQCCRRNYRCWLCVAVAETSLAHFHNVHNLLYLPDRLIVCWIQSMRMLHTAHAVCACRIIAWCMTLPAVIRRRPSCYSVCRSDCARRNASLIADGNAWIVESDSRSGPDRMFADGMSVSLSVTNEDCETGRIYCRITWNFVHAKHVDAVGDLMNGHFRCWATDLIAVFFYRHAIWINCWISLSTNLCGWMHILMLGLSNCNGLHRFK